MIHKDILDALNWRYAVKEFDATKKISQEDMDTILESARLAPSSIGLEPWKFIVVINEELRAKIRTVGYDQSKITEASHLVVIARRTDVDVLPTGAAKAQEKSLEDLEGLKGMAEGGLAAKKATNSSDAWMMSQTYIALGMMVESAALLGIDSCPMEGFDAGEVDTLLGLEEQGLTTTSMLAVGYRGDDPYAKLPKTRRTADEVITYLE